MKNYTDSIYDVELTAKYCKKLGVNLDEETVAIVNRLFFNFERNVDSYKSVLSKENGNHVDEDDIIKIPTQLATMRLVITCSAKQLCIEYVMSALNRIIKDERYSSRIVDKGIMELLKGIILICEDGLKVDFDNNQY